MSPQDKHRVREIREQIVARYPQIETAPDLDDVLRHLPALEDPLEGVRFEDPLEGASFPEDIPLPDLQGMTDHARRVLAAIGEYQGSKARGRRKKTGKSLFTSQQGHNAIGGMSLADKRSCA